MTTKWINTTLLTIIIGMLAWFFNKGFEKMDVLNSATIRLEVRVASVEGKLVEVPSRAELLVELSKRDAVIKGLTETIANLRRITNRP